MEIKALRWCSFLFFGILVCDPSSLSQPLDEPSGEVKGVVTDILDSTVPKAILLFEGGGQRYQVETDADGAYAIQLKPNTYTVTVTHVGFFRYRRAAFLVKKKSQINFDFQLWVGVSDAYSGYNFIEFEPVSHTHLKPLVLCGENHTQGTMQMFTGIVLGKKYPVVLTYNLLTLRADQLSYDRNRQVLWATGNVVWHDGKNKGTGENIQIWLNGPEPKVVPFTWQE